MGVKEPAENFRWRITEQDIQFSDEIMEINGKLNFYMGTIFNVDEMFGTHVETAENDDWLNVYANYDMAQKRVCDVLDITLNSDTSCEERTYPLDAQEKEILLKKMDAYCMDETGLSLEAYCDSIQAESEDLAAETTQQM